MKLSVIMPVYNEIGTIAEIISRVRAAPFNKEIIIIDDGSTDGAREYLRALSLFERPDAIILFHDKNYGKGQAIRTGLKKASGDIIVIQDADLEYNPQDYGRLIQPIMAGKAAVVYGSRNLKENPSHSRRYRWGGIVLSKLANLLYGTNITDEPTGYKAFKTSVIESLPLSSQGFDFCPEVTAKLAKRGCRIIEVPISYRPRKHNQGKKINFWDGVRAVWTLVKYRFVD